MYEKLQVTSICRSYIPTATHHSSILPLHCQQIKSHPTSQLAKLRTIFTSLTLFESNFTTPVYNSCISISISISFIFHSIFLSFILSIYLHHRSIYPYRHPSIHAFVLPTSRRPISISMSIPIAFPGFYPLKSSNFYPQDIHPHHRCSLHAPKHARYKCTKCKI